MENILDDEFIIQMDDSPPFSWIKQTPERFLRCNPGREVGTICLNAFGNMYTIAAMAKDIVGERLVLPDGSAQFHSDCTSCIITYSGQLKESMLALDGAKGKGIVISSGGQIKGMARSRGWDYFPLPKGYSARFLFPEIFGCMLSIFGIKVETGGLDRFIESNLPSELSANNEAKQLALKIREGNVTLVYEASTAGLAMRFRSLLSSNSGIETKVKLVGQDAEPSLKDGEEGGYIFLVKNESRFNGVNTGGFPYDSSSSEGYVKNEIIAELSTLYLGLLRGKEIELFDVDVE